MQLKLTLYAKYFYKILNKEKTIEYRALTNYYENRFKKNMIRFYLLMGMAIIDHL